MATIQVSVFKKKSEAQKYAKAMTKGARVYHYEIEPYYISRTRKVQGWKVRKVRRPVYNRMAKSTPKVGGIEYKTVDTRTLKGVREAERLKRQGWTQGSVGFHTIEYYRRKVR